MEGVLQDYVLLTDVSFTDPRLTISANTARELQMTSNTAYVANQEELKTSRNVAYHAKIMQHLREQLERKKLLYSEDQIELSTTIGHGNN